MSIRALCVFCGSRPGHDPAHAALAASVGDLLARRRVTLVYGGGALGLMGITARACLAGGGRVEGVIPRFLTRLEVAQDGLTEQILVETLHERKAEMHRRSDALLTLPGGVGTLDELFETITWRELGLHTKPIWLLDANGYWAPLVALLGHMGSAGFANPHTERLAETLPDLDELARRLTSSVRV